MTPCASSSSSSSSLHRLLFFLLRRHPGIISSPAFLSPMTSPASIVRSRAKTFSFFFCTYREKSHRVPSPPPSSSSSSSHSRVRGGGNKKSEMVALKLAILADCQSTGKFAGSHRAPKQSYVSKRRVAVACLDVSRVSGRGGCGCGWTASSAFPSVIIKRRRFVYYIISRYANRP